MNFFSKYFVLSFFFCTMVFTLQPMFREYSMFDDLDRSADTFGLIVEDTFLQHHTSLVNDNSIQHIEKPTLKGQIHITLPAAYYASKRYHEQLCQAGIASWIQTPVIPVTVLLTNEFERGITVDWVSSTPPSIIRFETEELHNTLDDCLSKKFPVLLPAPLLYRAKTGTKLSLTIHGYSTQLECVNHPHSNSLFEDYYTNAMQQFLKKASYCKCSDKIEDNNSLNNLIQLGLLVQGTYEHQYMHGENRFVSVEKLLYDRIQEKNKAGYLLLCLVHALPRLTKEAQDI